QGRTNAKAFNVAINVPPLYAISHLDVFGLDNVLVGKIADPSYPNRFWVSFASDSAPEVADISLLATVILAKTSAMVGTLHGHCTTSSDKPLSRLKLIDCASKALELDLTANEDIKRQESVTDLQKWTLGGQGAVSLTPPQVKAVIEDVAEVS